jgi:hypothetical protein
MTDVAARTVQSSNDPAETLPSRSMSWIPGGTFRMESDRPYPEDAPKPCCIPENPRGRPETAGCEPCQQQIMIPRTMLDGASHRCAANYCRSHRSMVRPAEPVGPPVSAA